MAYIDYEKKGNIVIITLNRPARLNAQGQEVTDGIKDAFKKYMEDKEAKVAILTGTGRAFSAGVDINEVAGPPIPVTANMTVEEVPKPVIAAVNGFALGLGCWLMIACDIRIAARSATFGMPEISRAIPLGPERFLAQRIPSCVVVELSLTGERISAQRAYEVGLINKVVPDEELMPAAMKMAEKIAEQSPWAIRLDKEAKIKALAINKKAVEEEQERRLLARDSDDFKEAVKAFLEKRKPVFKV